MIESRLFQIQSQATVSLAVMQELRTCEQLCDVVLCVGGAKFSAHRVCMASKVDISYLCMCEAA